MASLGTGACSTKLLQPVSPAGSDTPSARPWPHTVACTPSGQLRPLVPFRQFCSRALLAPLPVSCGQALYSKALPWEKWLFIMSLTPCFCTVVGPQLIRPLQNLLLCVCLTQSVRRHTGHQHDGWWDVVIMISVHY